MKMRRINNGMISASPHLPASFPPTVRSVQLAGPAGRLEAILNSGSPHAPFAALVCHPHPLGGGNLHNKVVYHAMKALNAPEWGLAWPVLRFNFRGTGLSDGVYHGEAEAGDVLAALDWLQRKYSLPIVGAGFSFGAAMLIKACCDRQPNPVRALAALGLPVRPQNPADIYPSLASCLLPKLFLSGDQDRFATAAELARIHSSAAEPKKLVLIPGADHFFTGHLDEMQQTLSGWLKEQLP